MTNDVSNFLDGKTQHAIDLFEHFVTEYRLIGDIQVRPAKSMIIFSAHRGFAYVIQLGKNFIDVVFPFKQVYADNLCFNKIKPVPGSDDYNHHLRIYFKDDLNNEVRKFMRMAYNNGLIP